MSSNINANRILTGASAPSLNLAGIVLDHQKNGSPPALQQAVVQEVIYNPKVLSTEDRERLKGAVVNPEMVDQAACNSIVATLISEGTSDATPSKVLLFPFFQSHFMLPIQAGEQVTVIFDDFQKFGIRSGKWLTRTSEGLPVEDPNFTHGDRRYAAASQPNLRVSASLNRANSTYMPGFPNGGGESNTNSLPQDTNTNPYDTLYRATKTGSLQHEYEVVPRWTKRPQEFVLQGMNNSLIMLGQDRVGSVTGSEQKSYAGTVDIVAGRGRYPRVPSEASTTTEHKATSPFVIANSRSLLEVDKTPKLNDKPEQLREGDPDFIRDAARIYLSMKTEGDKNFRLVKTAAGAVNNALQPSGINYSPNSIYPVTFTSSSQKIGSSYIVEKADHIRIIARRTPPSEDSLDPAISGSILIIKEGKNRTAEDRNVGAAGTDHLAYLYMSPEGRVQIDGMQIFLGGGALRTSNNQAPPPDRPNNPAGANGGLSVGGENQFAGAEPFIKWSEFKKVVEGLQKQIDDLQTAYSSLADGIRTASVSSACTPGGPDTAWAPLTAKIQAENARLETNVSQHRNNTNQAVFKSRSARVFAM